ncbi:MAG TPA: S1/P1 nuclease [Rhizomicrobium sp.]|jgi:hypothetical protein|nr:S1/P1 nuclease [Rhizomicrobium sp.]
MAVAAAVNPYLRGFLAMSLGVWASPVLAWGPEGHEVIAHIAARELTAHARAQVAALLGGGARPMMVADANWADEIRDSRPDTARWHFVNIPLGAPHGYDRARDCASDDCVVDQIERDARIVADRKLPRARRAEALKFLIHFVGDVHQPLHTIDNHDNGGNGIAVRIAGTSGRTNMHRVWDTLLVEREGGDAGMVAAQIEAGIGPRQRAAWQSGTPAGWASESWQLARREIYARVDGGGRTVRLSRSYLVQEEGPVRVQLAKAGLRLARMLNTIFR